MKMYKDGVEANVDKAQIPVMKMAGWSSTPEEAEAKAKEEAEAEAEAKAKTKPKSSGKKRKVLSKK